MHQTKISRLKDFNSKRVKELAERQSMAPWRSLFNGCPCPCEEEDGQLLAPVADLQFTEFDFRLLALVQETFKRIAAGNEEHFRFRSRPVDPDSR